MIVFTPANQEMYLLKPKVEQTKINILSAVYIQYQLINVNEIPLAQTFSDCDAVSAIYEKKKKKKRLSNYLKLKLDWCKVLQLSTKLM